MAVAVVLYDVPSVARDLASEFLPREPVLNNLVLTLLAARCVDPQPGRYWVASERGEVAGMGLQSPLDRPLLLTAMSPHVAAALADAIGARAQDLPGVLGEAQTAARFAGQWTERRKTGAHPVAGQRVYEARSVEEGRTASGAIERAGVRDKVLIGEWLTAFQAETGEPSGAVADFVERRVSAGDVWIWNDGGVRSMAAVTAPTVATSRVQYVYTPPQHRRNGYAETLVRSLTQRILGEGVRPMLFADLGNPMSNGVYRRIGYKSVAEVVRYRFDRGGGEQP